MNRHPSVSGQIWGHRGGVGYLEGDLEPSVGESESTHKAADCGVEGLRPKKYEVGDHARMDHDGDFRRIMMEIEEGGWIVANQFG